MLDWEPTPNINLLEADSSRYYQFSLLIIEAVTSNIKDPDSFRFMLVWSFFLPFPLLIAIAMMPTIIFLEIIKQRRNEYMRSWVNKFSIKNRIE